MVMNNIPLSEHEEQCCLCGRRVVGERLNMTTVILSAPSNIKARICRNCAKVICAECAKKSMKPSLWSGYEKSPCPLCGKAFGQDRLIVNIGNLDVGSIIGKDILTQVKKEPSSPVETRKILLLLKNAVMFPDAVVLGLAKLAERDVRVKNIFFPNTDKFVCKRCGSPLKWKMEICPKCQQKIIVGWPDVINEVVSFLVWVITLGPIGTLLERNTIGGTILRYTPLLGTLLHISDAVNPYAASPKRQRGVNPRRAEIVFVVDNDTKLPMPLPLVAWNGFPPLTMELIKGEIQREKDNGRKEVLTKTLLIVEALFLSNYEE